MNTLERICVVDDDPVFTFLLKKMIEKAQITADTSYFGNGQDAIDFLIENQQDPTQLPQMIILDINMPILDGWQFLDEYARLLSALPRPIPIFMASSSSDAEDKKRGLSLGLVIDYVQKPIYVPELLKMVETVGAGGEGI